VKQYKKLKKHVDFKRVRHDGKSYAHPFVILFAQENNINILRIGVTAEHKIGGAVQRNRAKRILRAAIAPLTKDLKIGYDLVLLGRRPILRQKSHQIQKILEERLRSGKLLNKNELSE
jgi:ribonuclease P protein component